MRSTQINWTFRLLSFCLLLGISFAVAVPTSSAQQETSAKVTAPAAGKSARLHSSRRGKQVIPARNTQISKIVSQIDPHNIERTIRKLVSFGTRNTLSEQDNPTRGIGAARDWLYGEFMKAAQRSGGRMTVE
jgi:hypothetical protein